MPGAVTNRFYRVGSPENVVKNGKLNNPTLTSGSFSFTYLLYMRERFSAVGASCARDIARKP